VVGAFGLSQQLKISITEAKELMGGHFEHFGGMRDHVLGIVAQQRRTEYTEALLADAATWPT